MSGMPVPGTGPFGLSVRVGVVAAVLTALVVVLPFAEFAYRAPALHIAVETVYSVVGLLVAFLVYGRYRISGRRQELLLVLALSTVAVANLLLTALPAALPATEELDAWAPLGVRVVGTLLLAAAALTSPRAVTEPGSVRRPVLVVAAVVVGLSVAGLILGDDVPPPVDPGLDLEEAGSPVLAGHPVALGAQILSGLLYAAAAVAFTRQAAREDDELLRWVGAGCVLAAFSRVHYVLFPSLYTDYVYTGDALRLGFYVFMLIGATREIRSFWESRAQAAVLEDRRRLARDLHDGLTQELTYIYAQTRHLSAHPDDQRAVERINDAAARAIDEARTAIAALARTDRPCFADVLRQSVDGLASRYEVRGVVDVEDDVVVPAARADAILRVVGEAFRNAVRHGRAACVSVRLHEPPLTLVVTDDGEGFDVAASDYTGGFGLTSMRERAASLDARLEISSAPGDGTTVEVVWS
jgi:signal transduction histidine kinase